MQGSLAGGGHVGIGVLHSPAVGIFYTTHHQPAVVGMPGSSLALVQHKIEIKGIRPYGQVHRFVFPFQADQ